jgi:UDP-N-acetylmuramate--alanine ligase
MNVLPFRGRRVHLMGIGGAGVSALVPLLQAAGAEVDGCDLGDGATVRRLRAAGVPVALGHDAQHGEHCDILVHTSAVPAEHPELRAARARGAQVLSRPACLAALLAGTATIAVAGSHGKTSTTWMIGHLLLAAGADPLVMVGGDVADLGGGGARVGQGLCVVEVDESDGGFRHVAPRLAVLTNLDHEHLRTYGSFAGLCDAFAAWLAAMGPAGIAVVPATGLDPRVTAGFPGRLVRTAIDDAGADADADACELAPDADGTTFTYREAGHAIARVRVPLPGRHMVSNAVMALAATRALVPAVPLDALARSGRVSRRFTVHGSPCGVRVVEDYGHHPTEVAATIAAARAAGGRCLVVFQPHRHSRTADCFAAFATCFDEAHAVALLPVYAAGEESTGGPGSLDLAEAVAARRESAGLPRTLTQYVAQASAAVGFLAAHAQAGDTILVLGAGDVGRLAPQLVEALEREDA